MNTRWILFWTLLVATFYMVGLYFYNWYDNLDRGFDSVDQNISDTNISDHNQAPVSQDQSSSQWKTQNFLTLYALWDSLTAGYQLLPEESFPARLEEILRSTWLNVRVINGWRSGDTSAQLRDRLDRSLWDAQSGDILLLTIGGNDWLQWLPLDQLETTMRAIIAVAKQKNMLIIIGWLQLPPNYWLEYTLAFKELYPRVADLESVMFIPFILDEVAAVPEFNLPDGIHPNATGQRIIADNVAEFILNAWVLPVKD
jgi:acyl-CoA thioesterase I